MAVLIVVQVGDVVEMLLSISFAVKDAMLDWERIGIDEKEWPPQRLDFEIYRIEHLSFASNMEAQFAGWLQSVAYPLLSTKVYGLPRMAEATSVSDMLQCSSQQWRHARCMGIL